MESERGDSGSRVDMVAGLLVPGADLVAVAVVVVRASDLISGVICYGAYGE